MENDFLSEQDEIEIPGNYMKLRDGFNRFRILGKKVSGYEYWTINKKPIRSKEMFESTPDIKKGEKVKEFWAMPVWNYEAFQDKNKKWQGMVQILEITQSTIRSAIKGFIKNPKWGLPYNYDIAIDKAGEMLETTYQIQAEPPLSEVAENIKQAYTEKSINLEALFANDGKGEDPFKA